MDLVVPFAETLALLTALGILLRVWAFVRPTTLKTAWRWAVACATLWTFVWVLDGVFRRANHGVVGSLWYAVAVAMLCPPIAVLGARRPVARVWTWFVVSPLVIVFAWPAAAAALSAGGFAEPAIETPIAAGYALVLLMGTGNYLGTRHTASSVFYAAAAMLVLSSVWESAPGWMPSERICRGWATLCISAACLIAWWQSRKPSKSPLGFDRVWHDFRDWFGIVWARRVQVRLNEAGRAQQWPVQLELRGFVPVRPAADGGADLENCNEQIEYTLRWLLRRFVDSQWIDRRLAKLPNPDHASVSVDAR